MVKKILVVDDQPELRKLLQLSFQHGGFEVAQASNGDDCLKLLNDTEPDVVVLDIMMPGRYDGFQVCDMIKRHFSHTRVILLSARSQPIDKELGARVGADRYITKPFSPTELISVVKSLL